MLTEGERAALREVHGEVGELGVRVRREGRDLVRSVVLFLSGGRAIALGRHVFLPPGREHDLATLAHELMHCRQYRAWGPVRYYARGFLEQSRHLLSRIGLAGNPYEWKGVPPRRFDEYGMEQQGQIVEDACRGDGVARRILAEARLETSPAAARR